MATTFTGLSEAQLDDVAVKALTSALPYLEAFSHKVRFEGNIKPVKGATVHVPVLGKLTYADKTPGTMVATSGSYTGVDVVLDTFLAGAVEVHEGEIAAEDLAVYVKEQIPDMVRGLAKEIVDRTLALVTAANFASATEIDAAALDLATLAAIRSDAKSHVYGDRAILLAGPTLASRMITLEPVVYAYGAGVGNVIAEPGIPGRLIGYRAFEYDELPDNDENLLGVVIDPAALGVAAGAPSQAFATGKGNIAYRRIITEPESGLSVQYTEVVDGGGTLKIEVCSLFGASKVDGTAAHRIVQQEATPPGE